MIFENNVDQAALMKLGNFALHNFAILNFI
jgi:hypothetical protein